MSHAITITTKPWPGHSIPHLIRATCECGGFATGDNAYKWVALMIQDHYAAVGLIGAGAPGSLLPDGVPSVGGGER